MFEPRNQRKDLTRGEVNLLSQVGLGHPIERWESEEKARGKQLLPLKCEQPKSIMTKY